MRSLARWGTLPLMAAPVGAWGFGFGDIELQSALNQPFRAEIEITATTEELESLDISLAGQAAWDRAGLFRAGFLNSLNFEVTRDAAGRNVLVVTSNQSITEPFVTMLLEAEWARGRMLREYTALLDPPTMLPGPEGPVPVSTPEAGGGERVAGGAIEREPAPRPAPQRAAPPPAPPRSTPAPQAAAETRAADAPGTYGPVQRGETLWAIANDFRPSGVSMNQMLVALYRANPEAFDGNMNLLRRGAILRIPGASELTQLSAANASAEVASQTEAWLARTGAQPQLTLRPPAEEQAAAGPAAGGDAAETASGAGSGEVTALRDEVESLESELAESRRLIELRDEQLADLQSRISELEQSAEAPAAGAADAVPAGGGEAEEPLFADEAAPEGGEVESGAAPAADGGAEAEPEPVAETPSEPEPVASAPAAEPSLVARVLGWLSEPFVWIGLGVLALLLAGFGYVRRRRSEVDDVTGRWEAFEAEIDAEEGGADHVATARLRRKADPSAQDFVVEESGLSGHTGRFSALDSGALDELDDSPEPAAPAADRDAPSSAAPSSDDTLSSQTVINLDQADPVAEADFHMAYGLYDQAADLMTKALESDPGNRAYKLKLLEVYFVWGNKEAFLEAAKDLRGDMGESPGAEWDKVIIMGKQICPDEPMFAEAHAAAGEVDVDLEAGSSGGLDFAFGDDDSATSIDELFGQEDAETDLTLESSGERESEYKSWREGPEDTGMLDIGATTAAGLDAAFMDSDEDDDEQTAARSRADDDSLESTQESPTIEQPFAGGDDDEDDWSVTTMESPTIENPAVDDTTMEVAGDTAETREVAASSFDEETGESPTLEQPGDTGDTSEMQTLEQASLGSRTGEYTAELELDDLGLDVSDFESLPDDLGDTPAAADAESDTREQPAVSLDDDDPLLSATGVTQVLGEDGDSDFESTDTSVLGDDDKTMMAPGGGQSGGDVDFDLGEMTSAFGEEGDTVEQPQRSFGGDGEDVFSGSYETPVDLDVGGQTRADDEPTDTSRAISADPQTMTEVGTKLDLARAYIDMGDPEGARSILDEVLDEGDSNQRREAQTLLDALSA